MLPLREQVQVIVSELTHSCSYTGKMAYFISHAILKWLLIVLATEMEKGYWWNICCHFRLQSAQHAN